MKTGPIQCPHGAHPKLTRCPRFFWSLKWPEKKTPGGLRPARLTTRGRDDRFFYLFPPIGGWDVDAKFRARDQRRRHVRAAVG